MFQPLVAWSHRHAWARPWPAVGAKLRAYAACRTGSMVELAYHCLWNRLSHQTWTCVTCGLNMLSWFDPKKLGLMIFAICFGVFFTKDLRGWPKWDTQTMVRINHDQQWPQWLVQHARLMGIRPCLKSGWQWWIISWARTPLPINNTLLSNNPSNPLNEEIWIRISVRSKVLVLKWFVADNPLSGGWLGMIKKLVDYGG